MRIEWVGLVLAFQIAACGGDDDDGNANSAGTSGATGSGGQAASNSGGSTGSGMAGSGGARAAQCDALCKTASDACDQSSAQRTECLDQCRALVAVAACSAQVDAVIACQRDERGACEDGDYVVAACDEQGIAATSCVLEHGGGGGAGGTGGAGGEIPSSDAIDMIIAACGSLCGACGATDCMNNCRVSGARHLDCVPEYLDLVGCNSKCGPPESCATETEALRTCWHPSVTGTALSCAQTCEARKDLGCPGEDNYEDCVNACTGAEAKPACSGAIEAYTTCAASSRDICRPASGAIWTECAELTSKLRGCAETMP